MTKPAFGCPWHGKIAGGQLQVSAGKSIACPQPTGDYAWQRGAAALIAKPGVPVVVRDAEQQASDLAAGRQWLNRAVMAGDSWLHGKQLGSGAWIYIDPVGDRWLVSTTLHGAFGTPNSATVTLKRFGVLGGKPEQFSQTVPVPDLGQGTPAVGVQLSALRITRYHSSPTGGAALFMVGWLMNAPEAFDMRPLGWVELTIAGPGAAAAINVSVLKTRAQTLGPAGSDSGELPNTSYPYRITTTQEVADASQPYPVCTGTITTTLTPKLEPAPDGNPLVRIYAGTRTRSWSGLVLAMWYKPDGSISELTMAQHWQSVVTCPDVTASVISKRVTVKTLTGQSGGGCAFTNVQQSDWALRVARSSSNATTLKMSYMLDGVTVAERSIAYTNSYVSVDTFNANGEIEFSRTDSQSCVPGGTTTNTSSGVRYGAESINGPGDCFDVSIGIADRVTPGIGYLADWIWPAGRGYMTTYPARYSPQLWGWLELEGQLAGTNDPRYIGELSPSGYSAAVVPLPREPSGRCPFVYGSWSPLDGQSARSASPICFI